jgi:tetratricopeptide (TPR) repeat protein
MLQTDYSKYKYIPDEIDEDVFLDKFVVRTDIFGEIFEDIKSSDFDIPSQHYVVVGQRGQGKTSLLRKIQLEVQKDEELSKVLLPVKFAEEQYQIRTLCRLWELVAEYLENIYEDEFEGILDNMEERIDDDDYELRCFEYLESQLKSRSKKLLLLIDNIDELLGKLKEKEQRQLREILLTSSSFRIVGGSTKMLEQQYDYSKPFYEFFKIIKLQGLDYEESIAFLKTIAKDDQKDIIENIIENSPQKVETIRQLTGGVPRTLVMLYEILINEDSDAFEDLLKILNDATPLYKDRMDNLPPILQDIVHNIAMNWDGITTKELAKKTRLESKSVSSQLKQLEKYQIIDFESIGKNKIYKIHERFFNIWYLMRFGRKKDRSKVEWLVQFLTTWYSKSELNEKAKNLMKSIDNGNANENYIYNMCEALNYAGLDLEIGHELKEKVYNDFNSKNLKFKDELSPSDSELLFKVLNLREEGEIDKAINMLVKSNKNSKYIFFILGNLYIEQEKYEKAEEYYLKAIESGDNDALNNLGILYRNQKKYEKAEKYYLKAIESGDNDALMNLGNLYNEQKKYEKAEEYYLKAIESGDNDALNNLGILYRNQKKYEKAEEYYLKAIESGNNNALNNLGTLYFQQNNYDKAEECYFKAIESGNNGASNGLVWLYFQLGKNLEKSLSLSQEIYEKEKVFHTTYALAIIYLWAEKFQESYEKFIEWLEYSESLEHQEFMIVYINLLIAKGQYYKAKEFFEMEKYKLKDRLKPIWYALMYLMQNDFPHEVKKMGSELRQSLDDVLLEIEHMREKYSI